MCFWDIGFWKRPNRFGVSVRRNSSSTLTAPLCKLFHFQKTSCKDKQLKGCLWVYSAADRSSPLRTWPLTSYHLLTLLLNSPFYPLTSSLVVPVWTLLFCLISAFFSVPEIRFSYSGIFKDAGRCLFCSLTHSVPPWGHTEGFLRSKHKYGWAGQQFNRIWS